MCGGFFLWRRSCVFILSSCWGWGRLFLSLFWCDLSALYPGAPAVFHCMSCSWLPFSGSTPCWLRLAALLLRWTDVLIPHLVFYLVPVQLPLPLLPLWGFAPLAVASTCLSPVCWSAPGVGLEGSLLRHLVFSPCAMLFLRACNLRCLPCCRLPWGFSGTGCLSFSFPGGVGWASALPFFF